MAKRARVRGEIERWLGVTLLALGVACSSHAASDSADAGRSLSDGRSSGSSTTPLAPSAPASEVPSAPAVDADSAAPAQSTDSYDDKDPTALEDFHPALDAHGTWADDPTYGTVWTPNTSEAGSDFVPYVSAGHWVYGDDYVWTSDFTWGWAPFHYGRWVQLEARGWSWIPGREYAPAWVEWRTGDAYLGWAPAPPLFVWRGGVAITVGFAPPSPRYVFCAHGDLFSPQPVHVVLMGPRAVEIVGRTRVFAPPGVYAHFRHGPPPASLHIPPDRIVRATGREPGCARAQAFAHPSTAQRLGAHPPTPRHPTDGELAPRNEEGEHSRPPPAPERHTETHGPTEHVPSPQVTHAPAPHSAPPRPETPRRRK
jgi:hypothetical protein